MATTVMITMMVLAKVAMMRFVDRYDADAESCDADTEHCDDNVVPMVEMMMLMLKW